MLEQSHTEKILVEFLGELGYQVERKTALKSLTQNNEEVTSVLKLPSGQEETVTTKFVIGADGAHSLVREQLNIPFGGKTYQSSLFVLDCKAEVNLPADEMYLAFADSSFGGFFPLTNGRWRILGDIPKALEGKDGITFEDIEKNFAERVQMNVRLYDPQWIATYHAHHRYAATFKKGRCFLIGDAAHIHSPVGAQGMNTGLQDAYNLAWKLILVMKGKAKDPLLDTYTAERITIAKNLVRSTDRVFNLVTSANPMIKTFRKYVVPLVLKTGASVFEKLRIIRQFAFKGISEIGISYRKSTISQNASTGKFPQDAPKPGDRLPFIKFKDGNGNEINIQEKMHARFFCLFIFADNVPQEIISVVEPLKDLFSIEIIPITAQTKILYKAFGVKNKGCYLIRPDCYIAYRSQSLEAGKLENYLKSNLKCTS